MKFTNTRASLRRQVVVAGVLMALALCGRASAQVLEQVPSDALVVLKIKNLGEVSKKAAKMAKGLGLDQFSPDMADPLGALEEKAHLTKGVDHGGDFAFAFLDPAASGGDQEKSFLALVPVDDYKAFLGNFKTGGEEGGVTKATPADGGQDVYIASWGKFAAVSPAKELVAKKPAGGLKLDGPAAKEADTKDAVLYANMKSLRDKLLPELKKNRENMLNEIGKNLENAPGPGGETIKKFMPTIKVAIGQYLNVAEEFLQDARHATVGLNLGDEGITTTVLADFEPGSYIGKIAGEMKNTDASLLAGLPDRKYFFFGGSTNNPQTASRVLTDLLGPIKTELGKVSEAKQFLPAIDAMEKSVGVTTGVSAGLVAPAGALGTESILQQVSVTRGDAKVIHDAQTQTLKAMSDLFKALPQQKEMKTSFEFNAGAKTVDGVKLDHYETKLDFDEDSPQGAQAKQMLAVIYGPNGQAGVSGEVNDKTLITLQGASDQLIADAIAAAKNNTDPLSSLAGVKLVSAHLPKERNAVFYVDLGTVVNTSLRYARGFGAQVNVKLPQNLPPIGVSGGSEGSAIRVDSFIPATLVQGLVAAGIQFQQQFRNGAGGGL